MTMHPDLVSQIIGDRERQLTARADQHRRRPRKPNRATGRPHPATWLKRRLAPSVARGLWPPSKPGPHADWPVTDRRALNLRRRPAISALIDTAAG